MSSAPAISSETKQEAKKEILSKNDKIHLKALRKSARQLSPSQTECLMLAVMRTNLLMRGPAGTGKRWIARYTAQSLGELGERVELLTKFFGVSPQGQIWIDSASLPLGMRQLARASVIVVDDVPSQPLAAAAFFAHLDMLARVARCHPLAFAPRSNPSSKLSLTHGLGNKPWGQTAAGTAWSAETLSPAKQIPVFSPASTMRNLSVNDMRGSLSGSILSTSSTAAIEKEPKLGNATQTESDADEEEDPFPRATIPVTEALETLAFGGLQILGTQNAEVEGVGMPTVAWGSSVEPPSPPQPPSAPSFASSSLPVPPPQSKTRFGVVVNHASQNTSPSPHIDVFVIVFRSA